MTGTIRALEHDDLPQVIVLYERAMRPDAAPGPPGLKPYFERTFLDHPWLDPEIPSLVYEVEGGRIIGFIGSHVRRLRLGDRSMRMGVSGQLVSESDKRHLAVGAKLMRRYLAGPQDLSITDGATRVVHELWVRLGGYALHPESVTWIRPLRRPSAVVAERLKARRRHRLIRLTRPPFAALDAASRRLTRPPSGGGLEAVELTAQALSEHHEEVLGNSRVRVDYDEGFADWIFREMEAVRTRGTLVRRLLRDSEGIVGWYVVYVRERGVSNVMSLAARRGAMPDVLDHLFADAWRRGAGVVEGRLEPELFEPLSQRRCLLSYGTRALFHSRHPEVESAMALGRSALTRLDGEWWMGHHTEPFT